mmetsp:Transcript_48624/g.150140  ORF Transcript_48624/g.150140 Transcript_48624/m.150140 type:complete len:233 (-) Transcript_48624:599-1297(-)
MKFSLSVTVSAVMTRAATKLRTLSATAVRPLTRCEIDFERRSWLGQPASPSRTAPVVLFSTNQIVPRCIDSTAAMPDAETRWNPWMSEIRTCCGGVLVLKASLSNPTSVMRRGLPVSLPQFQKTISNVPGSQITACTRESHGGITAANVVSRSIVINHCDDGVVSCRLVPTMLRGCSVSNRMPNVPAAPPTVSKLNSAVLSAAYPFGIHGSVFVDWYEMFGEKRPRPGAKLA